MYHGVTPSLNHNDPSELHPVETIAILMCFDTFC